MTIIAVSSILLASLGGAEMVFAQANQHVEADAIIQQDLATITFSDASLTVTLNNDGDGSVRLSDLVSSSVTTDNLGGNVTQIILDPADVILSPRNPNAAGVVDEIPFEIPSFQTGAHTVVYNKTHFTFNFDDPTFSGTTPNVILQANIQSDANTLPAIHEDKANIAFVIVGATPLCESDSTFNLSFGTLEVGLNSNDGTIVIENSGNMPINMAIQGDFWCKAADSGCNYSATSGNAVMVPDRTHFGIAPNLPYSGPLASPPTAKTPFTGFVFDASLTPVIPEQTLFTIAHSTSDTVYLQVNIELIPEEVTGGPRPNTFQGDLRQGITLDTDCN